MPCLTGRHLQIHIPVQTKVGTSHMSELQSEDRTNLLRLLIHVPILQTERGRDAVIELADLQSVRPHLDLSGEPVVSVPLMVKTLLSYGRITDEQTVLGRFLATLRDHVGIEQRNVLDAIIDKYSLMTLTPKPAVAGWEVPVTSEDVQEKIIGENTLRPIAFFQQALNASRSVAYLEVRSGGRRWLGSGFLISPSLLMTNHHVLPDGNLRDNTLFRFNYQLDAHGNIEPSKDYKARSAGVYHASKFLDYAVVELAGDPGDTWGYLPFTLTSPTLEDRLNIIQHPNGLPKQVTIQNNFVKFSNALKLQYVTSTLPGSSGSPVCNDAWAVVGVHHAGGMLTETDPSQLFFRNEAVAATAILADLPHSIRTQVTVVQ
jgi:V8-like Glu-specific endopeptidase